MLRLVLKTQKNPYNDIYGEGYQPANSLYGIASSNIIGKGIGASARKYGYLTQADNDYILAVTIEETGVFGLGLDRTFVWGHNLSFCFIMLLRQMKQFIKLC